MILIYRLSDPNTVFAVHEDYQVRKVASVYPADEYASVSFDGAPEVGGPMPEVSVTPEPEA